LLSTLLFNDIYKKITIINEYITVGKNSVIGDGLRVVSDVQENTLMKNNEHIIVEKG